jgi:hypothetical protein
MGVALTAEWRKKPHRGFSILGRHKLTETRDGESLVRTLTDSHTVEEVSTWLCCRCTGAGVAELADAQDLGSCGRKAVGVQIPPSGYLIIKNIEERAKTQCLCGYLEIRREAK